MLMLSSAWCLHPPSNLWQYARDMPCSYVFGLLSLYSVRYPSCANQHLASTSRREAQGVDGNLGSSHVLLLEKG